MVPTVAIVMDQAMVDSDADAHLFVAQWGHSFAGQGDPDVRDARI